ncbi:thioredoxin-2 [Ctenocephalides felis]|uniref:thioredoxin-2 n=1 Tax=Ctenocephalides felis TaxID=7515 RepID=UPI000E6E13F9|nr:thioredoxin-2 [Ctenocephalides felis]
MIAPKLEELAAEFSTSIVILKVDVDECEELAAQYQISSMPTFVFLKNGTTVTTFTGANYDKVRETITSNL